MSPSPGWQLEAQSPPLSPGDGYHHLQDRTTCYFPPVWPLPVSPGHLREEPQESSPRSTGPALESCSSSIAPWESTSPDPSRVHSITELPLPFKESPCPAPDLSSSGSLHLGCRRELVPQWMMGRTVRDKASFRIRLTWPQLSLLGPGWEESWGGEAGDLTLLEPAG